MKSRIVGFLSANIHLIAYTIVLLIIIVLFAIIYFYDKKKLSKPWRRVDYTNFPMNNGYYKTQTEKSNVPQDTQPSELVCEFCGHQLTPVDVFCEFCGYKISK